MHHGNSTHIKIHATALKAPMVRWALDSCSVEMHLRWLACGTLSNSSCLACDKTLRCLIGRNVKWYWPDQKILLMWNKSTDYLCGTWQSKQQKHTSNWFRCHLPHQPRRRRDAPRWQNPEFGVGWSEKKKFTDFPGFSAIFGISQFLAPLSSKRYLLIRPNWLHCFGAKGFLFELIAGSPI